ncbi:hypothetical protein CHS0354_034277 [Potamilus streckersoni]|uniref:Uncharacterized protein n=1 Tax=Potamilus streckersoni TaxID=2493646 RepID=A0AAE0S4L1_9BIVA|nr:hypothetical protein CHS0354_034277 [Potamilus streckersoni]
MSAAVVMTDAWQPAILRLVPFSSNSARAKDHVGFANPVTGKEHKGVREYPVLAVTRSCSECTFATSANEKNENQSDSRISVSKSCTINPVGGVELSKMDDSEKRLQVEPLNDRRKNNKTMNDMKGARFSVQNLNDQLSSSSSFKSSEVNSDLKGKKSTSGRREESLAYIVLPKPTINRSPDVNSSIYFYKQNGYRRAGAPTPGELDLQRYRETSVLNQSQTKKKYKLNINQLPRSTTPINDHDPDKLNMKQVIAFLQTKAPRDSVQKMKSTPHSRSSLGTRGDQRSSEFPLKTESRVRPDTVERYRDSRPNSISVQTIGSQETGALSVLSTSSPALISGHNKSASSQKSVSTKSCTVRSSVRSSGNHKRVKEFKLYRFLSLAPLDTPMLMTPNCSIRLDDNCAERGTVNENKDIDSTNYRSSLNSLNQENSSENKKHNLSHKLMKKSKANLLHTKVFQRHDKQKEDDEGYDDTSGKGQIRLPRMSDYEDIYNVEVGSDICSDVADNLSDAGATNNSQTVSHETKKLTERPLSHNNVKIIIKETSPDKHAISKNSQSRSPSQTAPELESHSEYNNPSCTISKTCEELPKSSVRFLEVENNMAHDALYSQKKIHVSLPKENKSGHTSEIVRLSLRHEKNASPRSTYMSDMKKPRDDSGFGNSDTVSESCVSSLSMASSSSYVQNGEFVRDSSRMINGNLNANGFIKVREMLKAQVYNTE